MIRKLPRTGSHAKGDLLALGREQGRQRGGRSARPATITTSRASRNCGRRSLVRQSRSRELRIPLLIWRGSHVRHALRVDRRRRRHEDVHDLCAALRGARPPPGLTSRPGNCSCSSVRVAPTRRRSCGSWPGSPPPPPVRCTSAGGLRMGHAERSRSASSRRHPPCCRGVRCARTSTS